MRQTGLARPDVYSARDIARATRRSVREVEGLFYSGQVVTVDGGSFVGYDEAIRVMRTIVTGVPLDPPSASAGSFGLRFLRPGHLQSSTGVSLAITGSLHGALVLALLLMAFFGIKGHAEAPQFEDVPPGRLVFLPLIGPGGGGGGGGLKERALAARAERKGEEHLSSPIPVREEPPKPAKLKPKPPETPPEPLPPIQAPVATVASDKQDHPGVTEDVPQPQKDSRGVGEGGGAGAGTGTGLGEGQGTGIGPGEGGGTGGGPYRPGSGITPPRLLREVKPEYTEEARRHSVEGEVEMEIVVRQNGTTGDIKVLRGLGYGLEQRAIDAVRQWRFSPASRLGQPVDVIVEVSVEFKLR